MAQERQSEAGPTVPVWLWRGGVGLLALVILVGLGLTMALALGWRTPTLRRAPDWKATGADWRAHGDGVATVAADGLHLRLTGPDQRAWAVPVAEHLAGVATGREPINFDLELDARSLIASQDVGYGLLYRYQDSVNYYLFAVGGDGYYTIAVVHDGTLVPLRDWQEWPHVRRDAAANRLRVRCEEATCRFYINGEFTAKVMDDTFVTGDVGLWAQTFSDDGLDAVFGEMRVWWESE